MAILEDSPEQTAETLSVLGALSNQLADAVERVAPALVTVDGRDRQGATGVVLRGDLIVTANHVLEREAVNVITHDGRSLPAVIVGRDPGTDLAVLRIEGLGLTTVPLAERPADVGQVVLAVGRPADDGLMASSGIVSSISGPLRRRREAIYGRYIHTDATPYPGFSGGALVDAAGAVLGIITTGLLPGATLAIPAGSATQITEELVQHGRVRRAFLGIGARPLRLSSEQRDRFGQACGLEVLKVGQDTPASQSGLQSGDVLLSLDGERVAEVEDLQTLLMGRRIGAQLELSVLREGALVKLTATITETP